VAGAAIHLRGNILLVGAGKMGGALIEGWIAHGLSPSAIAVIDPSPPPEMRKFLSEQRIERAPKPGRFVADAIVLAVKPQMATKVVPGIAGFMRPKTVVISIMAGRKISSIGEDLPASSAIVRAMPNTAASVGHGITVAIANKHVDAAGKAWATELLGAVGKVEWIKDERLIDAVTAVSGSGPAYVFLLTETLAKAGTDAGLPKDLAMKLARETVSGAGELLRRSGLDAAKLRANVTSPGGTTAAALEVLTAKNGLEPLMKKAVVAATRRSRNLAG
jgi:pyrroline-5-carboxylate reductase